jgi:hypothetical protein
MRGEVARSEGLFSYVSCEAREPANHPLRAIRVIVDEALGRCQSKIASGARGG